MVNEAFLRLIGRRQVRIESRVQFFAVLAQLLGSGGMGSVYRATREDDFTKQVALKLVQHERVSPFTLRRFHLERQILARLEHPNIARLLDGGTTGDGRPYLVMENVEGVPIDRYCEDRRLTAPQRREICRRLAVKGHMAYGPGRSGASSHFLCRADPPCLRA